MPLRFIETLLAARAPVIAEIKVRGAHGEDLLRDRPVSDLVASYEELGAPCLSVVTGHWFGGHREMLAEVVGNTSRPVLQKDFLTTERQVAWAARMGAAAVLLTARILPRAVLQGLIEAALQRGLTPFVEVVSGPELEALVHADRCVVAVNNKDIRQQERDLGDLQRSLTLLPLVQATGTRCPVSASGIGAPKVAAQLLTAGYAGLLVGTGMLRAKDPRAWWARFEREHRLAEAVRRRHTVEPQRAAQ